jgi:hypothetical protein
MRTFAWYAALMLLAACGTDATAPEVSPREVDPEMVTGAAAAALGPDGYFILATPATSSQQVSIDTAQAQVLEFAKYVTNNVLLRGVVENGRGGYWTDPHLLTRCSLREVFVRPQLQQPAVVSLPTTGRILLSRKFGPSWLVGLCGAGGAPEMTVQVALNENRVRFAGGAPIESDPNLLSAFSPQGVPLGWPDLLPISAERAVRFAFDQTGVRISEQPELFVRGETNIDGFYDLQAGSARSCNRWRIVLEQEVALKSGPAQLVTMTREVFVGAATCHGMDVGPVLQVPVANQATTVMVRYVDFSISPQREYVVPVETFSPIRFEVAEVVRAFSQ